MTQFYILRNSTVTSDPEVIITIRLMFCNFLEILTTNSRTNNENYECYRYITFYLNLNA